MIFVKIKYELIKNYKNARLGKLKTNYGTFDTPMFMPVGTLANVKTLTPEELYDMNIRVVNLNETEKRKKAANFYFIVNSKLPF